MTERELALFEKLLDNQRELIAAIANFTTQDQMEALRAIAEAQYNITESLAPTVTITGEVEEEHTLQ
jgi:hypothetical protein